MATHPYIPADGFEDVLAADRLGLLRAKDLARILAVSEKTVYAWVGRGELPYVKIGSAVRFRPAAIRDWLREKEFVPAGVRRGMRKR